MAAAQAHPQELLPPRDLWYHFSHTTKARPASTVKKFYKYFQIPGVGQLAGGLPAAAYFPFDDLSASVALPDRWRPTPNEPVEPPTHTRTEVRVRADALPSSHLLVPKDSKTSDLLRKIDVTTALQYGTAQGYPPLYQFLKDFTTKNLHPNIPYAGGPDICLTVGNTDGFSKVLTAFNNEWNGERQPIEEKEGLLVEAYAYMNAVQAAAPRGMNIVPVAIDAEGMLADGDGGLEDVLQNWDSSKGRRPHLMYTVTMGQNPTAGVLSLARRKAIYALCQKYDIIIAEDDPYWYLQYPSSTSENIVKSSASSISQPSTDAVKKSSGFAFLDSLAPSYLSVDVDGRVVRLDTFSKTIAPGCRLGWMTAQPAIIERILRITESSTQQPSGFVQAMVAELLMGPQSREDVGTGGGKDGKGWDVVGWVRWLEGLRGNYERRMNTMSAILNEGSAVIVTSRPAPSSPQRRRRPFSTIAGTASVAVDEPDWVALDKHKIYSFDKPMGGMFLWLTVHFDLHPLASEMPGPRLAMALFLFWVTKPYLVLAAPGTMFAPTAEIRDADGWRHFRLCFAACPEEEVEPITHRLVAGFHDFFAITDPRQIDKLFDDDDIDTVTGDLANLRSGVANLGGPC